MAKRALITGILGQDGGYLAELLLSKDYKVFGMVRRTSSGNYNRIKHLMNNKNLTLLTGDLADQISLNGLIRDTQPDEVYNLAAQSHVGHSFSQPLFTSDVTGLGVLRLLEAIKHYKPDARFYQASSSEQFGRVRETPQNELTPFHPRSPYGVAKAYGHHITVNYRESYNMFCCCGILFNHESPYRPIEFVTRKITDAVAKIKTGQLDRLGLGSLDPKRDWGFAGEYMTAAWLMLQQDVPDDYVVATGETHSVEEFCRLTFECVDLDYKQYIYQDPRFIRPAEVDLLVGNASKAKVKLGWEPKTKFSQLVEMMVKEDMQRHSPQHIDQYI